MPKVKSAGATKALENDRNNNLVEASCSKVFSDEKIIANLTKFLDFDDVKSLRLVNRIMKTAISNNPAVIARSGIRLHSARLQDPLLKTLSIKPGYMQLHPFTHAMLISHSHDPEKVAITTRLCELISECRDLAIIGSRPLQNLNTRSGSRNSHFICMPCPCIPPVLFAAVKLKNLTLNPEALSFLAGALEKEGKSLSSLRLLKFTDVTDTSFVPQLFFGVPSLTNLFVLHEPKGSPPCTCNPQFWTDLTKILHNSRKTLKLFYGLEVCFWNKASAESLDTISSSVFPVLNTISFKEFQGFQFDEARLAPAANFLRAHIHQLTILDFSCNTQQVLNLIIENDSEQFSTGLRLKVLAPLTGPKILMTEGSLRYFQNLSILDLTIRGPVEYTPDEDTDETDIISLIPTRLMGLVLQNDIRPSPGTLVSPLNANRLQEFILLSTLELKRVDGLSPQFIASIFDNLPHLTRLVIQGKDKKDFKKRYADAKITDQVFLGRDNASGNNPRPPLTKLKQLEHLQLSNLGITLDTITKGVEFPALRTLEIDLEINSDIVMHLLSRNPSLKYLACGGFDGSDEEMLFFLAKHDFCIAKLVVTPDGASMYGCIFSSCASACKSHKK